MPASSPSLPKPAPNVISLPPSFSELSRARTSNAYNPKPNTHFISLFKPPPSSLPPTFIPSFSSLFKTAKAMSSAQNSAAHLATIKEKGTVDRWLKGKRQLPLSPSANKDAWKGRCFRCLALGNDRVDCQAKVGACAHCRVDGHETWKCEASREAKKKAVEDTLVAKGNLSEDKLPVNRPVSITVYVP